MDLAKLRFERLHEQWYKIYRQFCFTPLLFLMFLDLSSLCLIVSHTASEIYALINKLSNVDWSLGDKLDGIASDSGSNFRSAVKMLVEDGVAEESIRCSCHTLQLSIKGAIEVRVKTNFFFVFNVQCLK